MKLLAFAAVLLLAALQARATDWVEVGADIEAQYYVDVDSIEVDGENLRFLKKGVYSNVHTETFGGQSATFRETVGTIELDCGRRINRVTRIDMIGANGEVVWSSGPMPRRMWEDVKPGSHTEATMEIVCARVGKT
jgi:hypothetical protein